MGQNRPREKKYHGLPGCSTSRGRKRGEMDKSHEKPWVPNFVAKFAPRYNMVYAVREKFRYS
jgi:hypothetical protein